MRELKKILYVEDQKDIQMIAKAALETIGEYELMICSSGIEALAQIVEFKPDLLLLDVMMPGMDGPATLKEIKKRDDVKNIPVIFMTAKVLPSEIDQLMSMGAISIVPKPFDPVTLANNIQQIWNEYFSSNP